MFLTLIFFLSGLAIILLIIVKRIEDKTGRSIVILNLISKGDMHARDLSHRLTHEYSEFKMWAEFFVKKQLPMQTRGFLNRTETLMNEKSNRFLAYIRNSRLLKKSDGISEFFKNIGEVEKGNGEISDYYDMSDNSEGDNNKIS